MLTILALNFIAKAALAYHAYHTTCKEVSHDNQASDYSHSNNVELKEESEDSQFRNNRKEEDCWNHNDNIRDIRCDEIFLHIANVLKTPSEDSIFNLEALFVELKRLYPYTYSCSCTEDEISEKNIYITDFEDRTVEAITDDFEKFLSNCSQYDKTRESLTKLFTKLKPLLKNSLRGDSDLELMASYFKDKGKEDEYAFIFLNKIWKCYEDIFLDSNNRKEVKDYKDNIYPKYSSPPQIRNYNSLLGMAGRTYSKLLNVYKEESLFEEQGCLSNEIVYDIAGTILEYTDFYFCSGLSTPRLAKDIMDSMIDYLHNGLMLREAGQTDECYVSSLFNRYVGNREIKSYYYFLKMCVKVYQSICKDLNIGTITSEFQFPEAIRLEMIKNIKRYDFPFLRGLQSQNVYDDIQRAFNDKD